MAEIVKDGPQEYAGELTCHVCQTVFKVGTDDLGIDSFKADSNTYWFDGSATSVDKFYAWCPHRCDLIFIPDEDIPVLAQRKAVRGDEA